MVRVLMVCLGNICRSPLAEGILRSKVDASLIFVDSAGTGGWHVGEMPDHRSVEVARINSIDITTQRCRRFTSGDFEEFDHIYVMDRSNFTDVLSLAQGDGERVKVKMILDELYPGKQMEVPDPYYGGETGFHDVFDLLDRACEVIANKLTNAY